MNTHDRNKAAKLICQEYLQRRLNVQKEPTTDEIDRTRDGIIRHLAIAKLLRSLAVIEARAGEVVQSIVNEITAAYPAKRYGLGWRNGYHCSSSENIHELLKEISKAILMNRLDAEKTRAKLSSEERRLQAKVQTCTTREELAKILKSAGLI